MMRLVPSFTRNESRIRLSDVMGSISYALDLVEGQPIGHAVRACMIGMRIGKDLGIQGDLRSSLFYALLMKDLGCSSNAAKMCFLFDADDRKTKRDFKTANVQSLIGKLLFAAKHVAPGQPFLVRLMRIIGLAAKGERAGKELIQIRCERGARIAKQFGLSDDTSNAIHSLDEHFDGGGHPDGLIGDQIPLLARIMGLAQTAEVFLNQQGFYAMRDMLKERRGTWFDPELVDLLLAVNDEDELWKDIVVNWTENLPKYEPPEDLMYADESQLDDIASGFGQVIDAKSPWTFQHSRGVADVSVGIARLFGFNANELRRINRAALLHDVGKLGVSNLILDKPGKLNEDELAEMRRHPEYTYQILSRIPAFRDLASLAASHHEKLDGTGYHLGLTAKDLKLESRILCVADMYEALAAKRPYRKDFTGEEVLNILKKNTPNGLCPEVVEALTIFLNKSDFKPYQVAA